MCFPDFLPKAAYEEYEKWVKQQEQDNSPKGDNTVSSQDEEDE